MTISRRHFILGTAAGLILPRWYEKAVNYLESTGEPLIEIPKRSEIEIFAVDRGGDGLELNWGDPWSEPEPMTIRQFAERYYGSVDMYLECQYAGTKPTAFDPEAQADEWLVLDTWCRTDSPNAKAYRLLDTLDLGPDFESPSAMGALRFIDGDCPGSDYLGVEADDYMSVSLLQKRLNDLNTGIRIRIG